MGAAFSKLINPRRAGRRARLLSFGANSALVFAVLMLVLTLPGTSASTPTSTYRDAVLASNPASYWRLGESGGTIAADEMGLNPGSYVNGVTLGALGALRNDSDRAASFDGVNDIVSVPDASSLNATTGVTVEAWVKRTKTGAWQPLVGKPLERPVEARELLALAQHLEQANGLLRRRLHVRDRSTVGRSTPTGTTSWGRTTTRRRRSMSTAC